MKYLHLIIYLPISMLLCSCAFTKWDNQEELIGEWETSCPSFMKESKIIFYEDGTCDVKDIPTRDTSFEEPFSTTLKWFGNKKFEEKQINIDKWNFSGFWIVKEDTLYDILGLQYYRYRILMSPYPEMLGTDQECKAFMNCPDTKDAYEIEIGAWTETLFLPPARLHYLYYYIADPDNSFSFHKKKDNL